MGAKTGIEWAESTWTPIRARVKADAADIARSKGYTSLVQIVEKMTGHVGPHCEHAGTGCEHCYSETNNSRCLPTNGTGLPFDRRARDLVDIYMEEHILRQPLHWRKPRNGIFVCSQTDLYGEWVPDEMIDRVFAVMALCPQHVFICLTKRGKRMREYFCERKPGSLGYEPRIVYWMEKLCSGREYLFDGIPDFPLPNVILGVSGSTQADIDALVPELLRTPAACRLLSLEPQVEDVDLTRVDYRAQLRDSLEGFARWDARKNGRDEEFAASEARATVPEHLEDPADTPVLNVLTGEWFDGWDSGTDGQKLDWVIQGGESGANSRLFDLAWADKIRGLCEAADVAYFFKQAGARRIVYAIDGVGIRDPKGGDPSEWPERFRVRQMPKVAARRAW